MSRERSSSSGGRFDLEFMPTTHRRTLHDFSVHCSPATSKWIATITRGNGGKNLQFSFKTEREARKFAKSYAPPKPHPESLDCKVCRTRFTTKLRAFNCRNCGVCICERCSARWGGRMVPKTYANTNSVTIRVCTSCDWLSNAFCMALLQGKADDAKQLFDTGNINLRSSFAGINGEAMFPVHCAVMGGNLSILQWLVETHCCPVAIKRDHRSNRMISVQTSDDRSLVDLAMTGKPKLDVLRYLIMDKNMSVMDTKDPTLAPRALESLLRAGVSFSSATGTTPVTEATVHVVMDEMEESITTIEDACALCCSAPMDCVLIPCGHQVCCEECGKNLAKCPVCKANCSVLRIFRS